MPRSQKRQRSADAPPSVPPPEPPSVPPDEQPRRRSLLRREDEPIENEPGYATAAPWSVRGLLTLALLMALLQVVVASVAFAAVGRNDSTVTYASVLITVDPIRVMIYALVAMPFARRLSPERRPMRALETLSAGALIYLVCFFSEYIAVSISAHPADAHDGKQMAGAGIAALLGTFTGAALFPLVYRRLWMPRLPSARGPRGPRGRPPR